MADIDLEVETTIHKNKAQRILHLDKHLSKLQSIFTKLLPNTITDTKQIQSYIQLGYLLKSLEKDNSDQVFTNANIRELAQQVREVKKAMEAHYNKYVTEDEYLTAQLEAIDYYFEEYADE